MPQIVPHRYFHILSFSFNTPKPKRVFQKNRATWDSPIPTEAVRSNFYLSYFQAPVLSLLLTPADLTYPTLHPPPTLHPTIILDIAICFTLYIILDIAICFTLYIILDILSSLVQTLCPPTCISLQSIQSTSAADLSHSCKQQDRQH